MRAQSYLEIYNYEAAIEDTWLAILLAAGLPNLVPQFSSHNLVTPRIEIELSVSAPTGHRGQLPSGEFTFDAWNGSLVTRCVTRRANGGHEPHRRMLAACRLEALYFRDRFTPDRLPFHCVTAISENGKRSFVDREHDTDNTELEHKIVLSVREGAWPVI